jgi:hypothetical protein
MMFAQTEADEASGVFRANSDPGGTGQLIAVAAQVTPAKRLYAE